MSGRMWLFFGGVACALFLSLLAGWLLDAPGTALLGGVFPAAAAVIGGIVAAQGRRKTLAGLESALGDIEAGRTPTGGVAPSELAGTIASLAASSRTTRGFLNGITSGLPIPFLLVDPDERTLFTNEATMRMLEIDATPASQIGRTLAEVFYNETGRETVVGKAMRQDMVFSNKEVTITGHKGGRRDVFYNVFPLKDAAGTIIGGLCLYLDVTDLRAKEDAICRQNERTAARAAKAGDLAGDLAGTAQTLASRVDQASRAARDQRERLERVGEAVEQLGRSSRDIAEQAGQTETVAGKTRERAAKAADVMARVLAGMQQLSEKAGDLGEHMNTLSGQAKEVGGILGVISDIADQTNLLALNAAIEAARAGESGRGFAVVADEVRKLAEKTMAATKEVGRNVTAIRDSAEINNRVTGEAVALVADTTGIAGEAGEALDAILELADTTSAHVRAIAGAAASQTAAGDEAGRHGGEIAGAAADTSQAMDASARAVADLARVAADLEALFTEADAAG